MQPNSPHQELFSLDEAGSALPSLDLPPVPFARAAAPVAATSEPVPTGTSVQDLLGALSLDGLDGSAAGLILGDPMLETALTLASPAERPFEEFSVDVERRGERERRTKPRSTSDRRSFTSSHMAAPDSGPHDPRPTEPPTYGEPGRANPIDAVMPPLPLTPELEPARPYELPTRGLAVGTQRSTRASIAVTELPFPATALDHPPQPQGAPTPPTVDEQFPAMAPVSPAPVAATGIESIFDISASSQVGHLTPQHVAPTPPAAPAPQATALVMIPDSGPAGPAMVPSAGMQPVAATVAAAPSAWYGGAVQVDDSMLVWNGAGTQAPLGQSVAALISQAPPVASEVRPAAGHLATSPIAPAAGAGAGTKPRGSSRSPVRLLLLVAVPATAGIGLALAIDRFLF